MAGRKGEAGAPWLTPSLCPGLRSPLSRQRWFSALLRAMRQASFPFPGRCRSPRSGCRAATGPSQSALGASGSSHAKMRRTPEPAAAEGEPRRPRAGSRFRGTAPPGRPPPAARPAPRAAAYRGRAAPGGAPRGHPGSWVPAGRVGRPLSFACRPRQSPRPGRGPRCCPGRAEGRAVAPREPRQTFTFPEPGSTGQLLGTAF